MGQTNIEQDAVVHGFSILVRQSAELSQKPLRDRQKGQIFGDRERIVALLVKVFGDVDGQLRKTREQTVDVLGAGHAEQRFGRADRDRRALDVREHDFLAEDRTRPQDGDQDVLAIRRAAGDAHHSAFNQIDEVRGVARLEQNVPFGASMLHKEMLTVGDGFVACALEEPRVFQVPDLIFRSGRSGSGQVAR